jgi:hypothetical protein
MTASQATIYSKDRASVLQSNRDTMDPCAARKHARFLPLFYQCVNPLMLGKTRCLSSTVHLQDADMGLPLVSPSPSHKALCLFLSLPVFHDGWPSEGCNAPPYCAAFFATQKGGIPWDPRCCSATQMCSILNLGCSSASTLQIRRTSHFLLANPGCYCSPYSPWQSRATYTQTQILRI